MCIEPSPLKVKVDVRIRKAWGLQMWRLLFQRLHSKALRVNFDFEGKGPTRIGF